MKNTLGKTKKVRALFRWRLKCAVKCLYPSKFGKPNWVEREAVRSWFR